MAFRSKTPTDTELRSVKVGGRTYRTLRRLAEAEQRTITAVIDRAVDLYAKEARDASGS